MDANAEISAEGGRMKYRTNKGKDLIEMITDGFIQKDTVRYHDESYLERGDILCPMRKIPHTGLLEEHKELEPKEDEHDES